MFYLCDWYPQHPGRPLCQCYICQCHLRALVGMQHTFTVWPQIDGLPDGSNMIAGWWFGCHQFYFPIKIGNSHPN